MSLAWKQPLYLQIGIPALILLLLLGVLIRRRFSFEKGVKAAGASLVRALPAFQKAEKLYRLLFIFVAVFLCGSICSLLVLAAGPYTSDELVIGQKKRDVFLCMDTDIYLDDLNAEVIDGLIDIVREFDGDRVGVFLFNSSTFCYIPMTDDYDYAIRRLEEVKEMFRLFVTIDGYYKEYDAVPGSMPQHLQEAYEEQMERLDYLRETIYEPSQANRSRGFCVAGDGLASCMYAFPKFGEEERSRVILFSTANIDFAGSNPRISVEDAADLCASEGVTVFSLFRGEEAMKATHGASGRFLVDVAYDTDYAEAKAGMEYAARVTGGDCYEYGLNMTAKEILLDIQKKEAMQVDEIVRMQETMHPEIPVIFCILCMTGFLVLAARLRW